jgi:hypothetical protein
MKTWNTRETRVQCSRNQRPSDQVDMNLRVDVLALFLYRNQIILSLVMNDFPNGQKWLLLLTKPKLPLALSIAQPVK